MLLVLLVVANAPAPAAGPVSDEYQLKAALIYKLTHFVKWPTATRASDERSFGICVLGRDPFGKALDALEGRKVNDVPIRVRRFRRSDGIGKQCRILFISDSKQAFVDPILKSLEGRPVLTLGDMDRFADKGGMIQFSRGGRRIGFRINLARARAAGLKLAAPLLQLATIVGDDGEGDAP